MSQNPSEYIGLASGIKESMANVSTCAIETAQVASQCNDYLLTVFVVGMIVGGIAVTVGVLIGVWYRGRTN